MGGVAVSSGAEYQAATAAFIGVCILLHRRLSWAGTANDTPIALEGEVGGVGDDLRTWHESLPSTLEIQCKKAINGQVALADVLTQMSCQLATVTQASEIVLVVGPATSSEIRDVFAADVRQWREGRKDAARSITKYVLAQVPNADALLARLYVVSLDVDSGTGSGTHLALDRLRLLLVDQSKVDAAWALLVREGLKLNTRGRWTEDSIRRLLTDHGFDLKAVGEEGDWLSKIDIARELHKRNRPRSAAALLDQIADDLPQAMRTKEVLRQLHGMRGASALMLGDYSRAREEFSRAIDNAPEAELQDRQAHKRWSATRANYGLALLVTGEANNAERVARAVITKDTTNVAAWTLLARALDSQGKEPEQPPPEIYRNPDYQATLAGLSMSRGLWSDAVRLYREAGAGEQSNPHLLVDNCHALINCSIETRDIVERTRMLNAAERASNQAIAVLQEAELPEVLGNAHLIRSKARLMLGRIAAGREDERTAVELAPSHPNIVVAQVNRLRSEGNAEEAFTLLTDDIVRKSPLLRVLRAQLGQEAGRKDTAREDLLAMTDEAEREASGQYPEACVLATDVAIRLGETALAERTLRIAELLGNDVDVEVMRGRLSIAMGDLAGARLHYQAAADLCEPDEQGKVLAELAVALGRGGQGDDAIALFKRIGAAERGHPQIGNLAIALMQSEQFADVLGLLTKYRDADGEVGTDIPTVILESGIDIAIRRQDTREAIALTRQLVAMIRQTADEERLCEVLLLEARLLAQEGMTGEASDRVSEALAKNRLTPEQQVQGAYVLSVAGETKRAVEVAFRAVRAQPNDPAVVEGFVRVVLEPDLRQGRGNLLSEVGGDPRAPDGDSTAEQKEDDKVEDPSDGDDILGDDGKHGIVGDDCFVRLRSADGRAVDLFLYREPPVEQRLNEFLVSDVKVQDLIGRSVRDVVIRNAGTRFEQHLTIERVVPAVVVAFRQYMNGNGLTVRAPLGIQVFKVGSKPTVESLGPMLAVMYEGAQSNERILAQYAKTPLPLGTLAAALGKPITEVAERVAQHGTRRVHVEGPEFVPYEQSVTAATSADVVVATSPAILAAHSLGILESILLRYDVLVPQAMAEEWEAEIARWRAQEKGGAVFIRESHGRPVVDVVGADEINRHVERLEEIRTLLQGGARTMMRPPSALGAEDSQLRRAIGEESADAATIARESRGTLWADDLGLRVIASARYGVPSFPTVAILAVLNGDGVLSDEKYDANVLSLIRRGHDIVPLRASTVMMAFTATGKERGTADLVLERLADPRVDAVSAAVVSAETLRLHVTTDVVSATLEEVTTRLLDALLMHRTVHEVLPAFIAMVNHQFRLLQMHRQEIVSAALARASRVTRIEGPGQ